MYEERRYKPISAWGYFGYRLLFSIPIAGLILLIVFSFSNKNINRRNFARSYFCDYLIFGIIIAVIFVIAIFLPSAAILLKKILADINIFNFL